MPVKRVCELYGHRAQSGQTSPAMPVEYNKSMLPHGWLVFLASEKNPFATDRRMPEEKTTFFTRGTLNRAN